MSTNRNAAVSPVVGVMLMLVVTIVIAAVVSAFAGGLGSTTSKPLQLSLTGSYSISNGLSITHNGGDPIGLDQVNFYIRNSPAWGTSASKMRVALNKSQFVDSYGNSVSWLKPGDTIYILPPYNEGSWMQPGISTSYYYNSTTNIGKPIDLDVVDTSGHAITSIEFIIKV
ncbi:MAG: type IV pilin [Methanoregula sp.]|nr:type IV pilin [Methanoregula sp.]